jgi:hypothetical protein
MNPMLPDKTTQIDSYTLTAEATPGLHGMMEIAASKYAFQRAIREVIVPEGTEVINMEAFLYCINLRTVTLPASLRFINYRAFYSCPKLERIIYQGTKEQWSLIKIDKENPDIIINNTEPEIQDLTYNYIVLDDGTLRLDSYKLTNLSDLIIPESIDGKIVTEIGPYCFANQKITSALLPNTIKYIGSYAFARCTDLVSINIPDSVLVIRTGAFYLCQSLEVITLNHRTSSLITIESYAFYGCVKLDSITLPNKLQTLQSYALQYCKSLHKINIPGTLTLFGVGALLGCDSINLIEIDAANTTYTVLNGCLVTSDKKDLLYCPGATSGVYKVPDSVVNIFQHAFQDCKNLTQVILPETTRNIFSSAFYGCESLENINISNLSSILDNAFTGCTSLTNISINTSNSGRYIFSDCTSLEFAVIEEGMRSLNAGAFKGCTSLKVVNLPSTLTYIGYDVFQGIESEINILFNGTEYQWELLKVNIPDNINYTVTYNS